MKLLLTSAGLTNTSIIEALAKLLGKPLSGVKLAYIPTAANVEEGEKDWLINDLHTCVTVGFEVDIVDISAINKELWLPRLEAAEVLFFGGGNTFHLMYWIEHSGLKELLPELLEDRIYVGLSAGSCVTGRTIVNSVQNLFGEKYDLKKSEGLNLVEFQFIPHLNSEYFTKIREKNLEEAAEEMSDPVYALDDNSALIVDGKNREVVSEGEWLKFN